MMEAGRADASDVHPGTLADRPETLENGDVFGGVVRGCHVYNVRLLKPSLLRLLCTTIVAVFQLHSAAAAAVSEDVPVPGGTASLAQSLGIDPAPDRGRFVYDVSRLLYNSPEGRKPTADS